MENQNLKVELENILENESQLLDEILTFQSKVRVSVKKRKWLELESSLSKLQRMSDDFVELDKKRENLCEKINPFGDEKLSFSTRNVRSKLTKSKIENKVLNEYISTTQTFLQRIFDDVLPSRKAFVYGQTGKIIKKEERSFILNQVI